MPTLGLSPKQKRSLNHAVARAVGGYPIFRTDLHPSLPPWKETLVLQTPFHIYQMTPKPTRWALLNT